VTPASFLNPPSRPGCDLGLGLAGAFLVAWPLRLVPGMARFDLPLNGTRALPSKCLPGPPGSVLVRWILSLYTISFCLIRVTGTAPGGGGPGRPPAVLRRRAASLIGAAFESTVSWQIYFFFWYFGSANRLGFRNIHSLAIWVT